MSAERSIPVDVAVVGAGPAGIAAATRAAEGGQRVLLLDENPGPGGQIWRHRDSEDRIDLAAQWITRLDRSGASRWQGASVIDAHGDADRGFCLVVESSSPPGVVRARRVILATGARERFLPFPGWTLPGVFGIGGAQALHKAGVSFAGRKVVIAGSGALILPVAASLASGGATLLFVAEQAGGKSVRGFARGLWSSPRLVVQAARYRRAFLGTPYRFGWWIREARGASCLDEVVLTNGVATRTIACDTLCAGFGLVGNTELARLMGCETNGAFVRVGPLQETSVAGVACAGEPTGIGGVELAIAEGEIAGHAAAGNVRKAERFASRVTRLRANAGRMESAFALRDELKDLAADDTIVCRCEDVRMGAIDAAWGMRQARLYTRAGMGPCQGRVCGSALEFIHGWPPDRTRLPASPASVESLIAAGSPAASPTEHGAR